MEQIILEFYFVYDGMIILKSDEYDEALNKAMIYILLINIHLKIYLNNVMLKKKVLINSALLIFT